MDKKLDWSWLPRMMPKVAGLIAEKRKAHGSAWVNTCWQLGVVQMQPGHFFAAEGAIAVGMPAEGLLEQWNQVQRLSPDAALLVLPDPPAAEGRGN